MDYSSPSIITEPVGNNALSYNERISLGSQGKLTVPSLIVGTLADVLPGTEVVFEEVDAGKLHTCTGLQHLVETSIYGVPSIIMDNHNHALAMRARRREKGILSGETPSCVIHIDQHADMGTPTGGTTLTSISTTDDIITYANTICNVGNFLIPAQQAGLIDEIMQVRSAYKLVEVASIYGGDHQAQSNHTASSTTTEKIIETPSSQSSTTGYILDIDLDFRSDHLPTHEEKNAVKRLFTEARCCTIALSPYFMHCTSAIEVLSIIFSDLDIPS